VTVCARFVVEPYYVSRPSMPRGRSASQFDLAQARPERNRRQGNHRQHPEGVYLICRRQ